MKHIALHLYITLLTLIGIAALFISRWFFLVLLFTLVCAKWIILDLHLVYQFYRHQYHCGTEHKDQ